MYLLIVIFSSINIFFPLYIFSSLSFQICTIVLSRLMIKMQAFVGILIRFADTRIYVYQKKDNMIENAKIDGSIVTIPNHLSELESFYLGPFFNKYYPPIQKGFAFAKHSIRFFPFIGWLLLATGIIFVKNNNKKANAGQYDYIENKLKKDKEIPSQTLIFIEGTTYNDEERQRRNKNATEIKAPEYDNVLVPRTTGIYLVEKNIEITDEIYLSMKYMESDDKPFDSKYFDMTILQLLMGGHKPQQVHFLLDCKKYGKTDINDREKFNERIYQNFKDIDKNLGESLSIWNKKYHKEEITISFNDIIWSILIIIFIIVSIYLIITNTYYQIYFILVCIVYVILGFCEHNNVTNKFKTT